MLLHVCWNSYDNIPTIYNVSVHSIIGSVILGVCYTIMFQYVFLYLHVCYDTTKLQLSTMFQQHCVFDVNATQLDCFVFKLQVKWISS